jgi:hypothetical protein
VRVVWHSILGFALGWHVLALIGVVRTGAGWATYVGAVAIILGFCAAVALHPATQWGAGDGSVNGRLSWADAVRSVSRRVQWIGTGLCVYGMIVAGVLMALASLRTGKSKMSFDEVGPVGVTAFFLCFGAVTWLVGLSGAAAKSHYLDAP